MYTVNNYITDTSLLTNSLSVKLEDVAIAINEGLETTLGIDIPYDKTQWKYYLNISGKKHITNSNITIYNRKAGSVVELNKDMLNLNPELHNELLKQDVLYNDLLFRYPDDILYINGIIFPVDINSAIEAPDGTILAYNRTLVADNELSLIRELEGHIKGFLSRWHIVEYTITDELYLSGMLAVLYSSIPSKIISIRMSKIMTSEVHRFHMEHYFRSHLGLWEYMDVLNDESKIWLYNNITYLIDNIGKDEVLNSIIKNILSVNSMGIGKYVLNIDDINIKLSDINNPTIPIYNKSAANITRHGMNEFFIDLNSDVSLESVMKKEIIYDLTKKSEAGDEFANFSIPSTIDRLDKFVGSEQNSKLLEINSLDLYTFHGINILNAIIDEFVHGAVDATVQYETEYVDPNTGLHYNLTPKNSIYMLFALLQSTSDNRYPIEYYNYHYVIDTTVTKEYLLENMMYDPELEYVVEQMLIMLPKPYIKLSSTEDFKSYLSDVIGFYEDNNKLLSNLNDIKLSTILKRLNDKVLSRGTVDLKNNGKAIIPEDYLKSINLELILTSDYVYENSVNELILTMTGINLDKYGLMEDFIIKFTNIINKLTSYDTQVIKNINYSKTISVKHETLNISKGNAGVAAILDAKENYVIAPMEVTNSVYSDNFADEVYPMSSFNNIEITTT